MTVAFHPRVPSDFDPDVGKPCPQSRACVCPGESELGGWVVYRSSLVTPRWPDGDKTGHRDSAGLQLDLNLGSDTC